MLFNPPVLWAVVLNIFALAGIQLACAYLFTRMPEAWFQGPLAAPKRTPGLSFFAVKKWKRLLPDGAGWFLGGFQKRSLESQDIAYLRRFITETRRGEACHWTAMLLCTIPSLWNPWWACLIIAGWAIISNVPCIAVQRVNRDRLVRIIHRIHASKAVAKSARS